MQLNQLKPQHSLKKKKRVGRGGKRGTYSGRGIKGQKSRAGRRLQPAIRAIIKRYPKLRGYQFRARASGFVVLNVGVLEKKFNEGDKINPKILLEKEIIRRIKGKAPGVKILGEGQISKTFIIEKCLVSKQAKEKIEKAGGKII